METAVCNKCGFEEDYEPDEFGLDYYQAIGKCLCGEPTYNKKTGEPTTEIFTFRINDDNLKEE